MAKSIMVTGGAGMIGSNLVKRLVNEGWDVYVADNLWRGRLEYLNDEDGKPVIDIDTHFMLCDLSVYEQCEKCIGFTDYVVHLADIVAGIDYVFANQGELFRVNNQINSNLFACVRKHADKVRGLIYVGTVCSFPLTLQNTYNPEPLHEDDLFPAMPESAYGWSKLMGQLEIGYLEKETNVPCCTLMFHNVYGTPTDYGARSQVIPALIRKAVNYPEEEFMIWGSGKQGRAFIHVNDIVDALILALEKGWGQGWIQIGPDHCTSIAEIAYKVADISGKGLTPVFDTEKPEGDSARYADYSKAKEILGWEPHTDLDEGLRKSYAWIEKQIKKEKSVQLKPEKISMKIYQRKRDFTVCGVGFCPTTRAEFVKEAFSMPTSPVSGTIDLIGVPGILSTKDDKNVAEMYAASSFAAIDGMPIVRIAKKKGFNCERCAAPDIMGMMFEESVKQGKTHYFYGGKNNEVLVKLRANLERDYPGIKIVGMYSPPFRALTEEEDEKLCAQINEMKPDFLWVGIGAPKQEMWMWHHREKIHGTVMLGVGAGFNFFAGTLDKAPAWMSDAGLEWFYRLTKEPKRLWKRYILGGVRWLYYRAEEQILPPPQE